MKQNNNVYGCAKNLFISLSQKEDKRKSMNCRKTSVPGLRLELNCKTGQIHYFYDSSYIFFHLS